MGLLGSGTTGIPDPETGSGRAGSFLQGRSNSKLQELRSSGLFCSLGTASTGFCNKETSDAVGDC